MSTMQDRTSMKTVPIADIPEENRVPLYALKSVAPEDPRSVDSLRAALIESGVASAWMRKDNARYVDATQLTDSLRSFASEDMKLAREAEKGQQKEAQAETQEAARPAAKAQGKEAAPAVPEGDRLYVYTIGGQENKESAYFLGKLSTEMNKARLRKALQFDKTAELYFVDSRVPGAAEMAAPFRTDEAKAANAAFKETRAAVQSVEGQRVADVAVQTAGEKSGTRAKTEQMRPVILRNPKEDPAAHKTAVNAMFALARTDKGGHLLRLSAKNLGDAERRLALSGPASNMTPESKQKLEGLTADWKRGLTKFTEVYASVNGLRRLQEEMAQGVESSRYLDPEVVKSIRATLNANKQKGVER